MSDMKLETKKAPIAKAVVAAITLGVAASAVSLSASANPFELTSLSGGYMQLAMEGSCGGDKGKEGSCGGNKAKEGSCGGDKAKEGSCGGDKGKEGSCGEAKCGGAA